MVVEKFGVFLPSKLCRELREAGIDVDGITCTEDDDSIVTAVQIICADGTNTSVVDTRCKAHDPTPDPPAEPASPVNVRVLEALNGLDPATATVADVLTALKPALE